MTKVFACAALSVLIASCQKNPADTPPIDPGKQYSINVEAPDQIVRTKVEGNILKLDHHEKVHLLVDPVEFGRSWSLALEEDWSGTNLHNLDYTTMNEFGTYAHNWRPGNVNNLHPSQKTVIDTTVGGKRYKKLKIERIIHFYKEFPSQQAATDKQNQLTTVTNEVAKFKGYYTYNGVSSLPNLGNGKLVYVKQ